MRQVHHWTAVVFVAVIVAHLARVFFTGAFRRPRELNWLHRVRAAGVRDRRGVHRLLAARRPAVGDRRPDRVLGGAVDPVPRPVPRVAGVRRRVPDGGLPAALLRPPRDAAARAVHRRRSRPTSASCSSRSTPSSRSAGRARTTSSGGTSGRARRSCRAGLFFLTAAVWRCSAASCRSTRSGRTARSTPPSSLPGPARLVRGLARRRAPDLPVVRARDPGRHDPVGLHPRGRRARGPVHARRAVAVPRAPGHRRPRRAPPAGLAVGGAVPGRDRRRRSSPCSPS